MLQIVYFSLSRQSSSAAQGLIPSIISANEQMYIYLLYAVIDRDLIWQTLLLSVSLATDGKDIYLVIVTNDLMGIVLSESDQED